MTKVTSDMSFKKARGIYRRELLKLAKSLDKKLEAMEELAEDMQCNFACLTDHGDDMEEDDDGQACIDDIKFRLETCREEIDDAVVEFKGCIE